MFHQRKFFELSLETNVGGVYGQGKTDVPFLLNRIFKIHKLFEYVEIIVERMRDEEMYLMTELKQFR